MSSPKLLDLLPIADCPLNQQPVSDEKNTVQANANLLSEHVESNTPSTAPHMEEINRATIDHHNLSVNVLFESPCEKNIIISNNISPRSSQLSPCRVYRKATNNTSQLTDRVETPQKGCNIQVLATASATTQTEIDNFDKSKVTGALAKDTCTAGLQIGFQEIFEKLSEHEQSLAQLLESARHPISTCRSAPVRETSDLSESSVTRLELPAKICNAPSYGTKPHRLAENCLPHSVAAHYSNECRRIHSISEDSTPRANCNLKSLSSKPTRNCSMSYVDLDLSDTHAIPASPLNRLSPHLDRCKMWAQERMEAEEDITNRFSRIIKSERFKVFGILVIIVNFIYMIHEVDWRIGHLDDEEPGIFAVANIIFTTLYTAELFANVFAYRITFFCGDDFLWHWFDIFIVGVSIVDICFVYFANDFSGSGGLSFLKALRFLRMSRLLRMFRAMRVFKELRLMIDMFANSMSFFCWCFLLLTIFLSLVSIFLVQGLIAFLQSKQAEAQLQEDLHTYFGSVYDAMLSLLMACTGGNDWITFHGILKQTGKANDIIFLSFVLFSSIAFFNVIGGVFCEKAMSLAAPTVKELTNAKLQKDAKDSADLLKLLREHVKKRIDKVRPHRLDQDDFDEFLENPDVVLYFEMRGVSQRSVRGFFKLFLDSCGGSKGKVDISSFVSAIMKFEGNASSLDLHLLDAELKRLRLEIQEQSLYHQMLPQDEQLLLQGRWQENHHASVQHQLEQSQDH